MDARQWMDTDRRGERMTLGRVNPSLSVMSVTGSTRHWAEAHHDFCVALVTPGQPQVQARWRTRGRELETHAGGFMLIESGDVHVTRAVSVPSDFHVVRLTPEMVESASRELDLRGRFHFRTPTVENDLVARSLLRLIDGQANGLSEFELEILGAELTASILTHLCEASSVVPCRLDPVRDFRLRMTAEYLRAHLAEKPSLEELAKLTGLSKFRLCTAFKTAYGVTIGQYWTALRIEESTRLLRSGAPIRTVSAHLGFVDEAFFTRVFKRHRGLPPGAWTRLYEANTRRGRAHGARHESRPLG